MKAKRFFAKMFAFAAAPVLFAQTVTITNEMLSQPQIAVNDKANYWKFSKSYFIRDEIYGEAVTADKRAKVKVRLRLDVQPLEPGETSILSAKPRWSWNSAANASDGNRSAVAALLKPVDSIEIGIGNLESVGYALSCGPNISRTMWTDKFITSVNVLPGVAGKSDYIHNMVDTGLQVCYTGIPNLKVGVGLVSPSADRETTVKKGLFNGIAAGAKYSSKLFDLGANWRSNFGAENGYKAGNTDKAYQDHTVYAGFTYKGLSEAKIGTKINAALGYYTSKASAVAKSKAINSFCIGVGADFNFRNGISDSVNIAVGYTKEDGLKSQVLPFVIRNSLKYTVSKDAAFTLELCYSHSSLKEKTTVAAQKNITGSLLTAPVNKAAYTPTLYSNECGWLVVIKPTFTFSMGSHVFSMGVKAIALGDIVPHAKQGTEWSWTGLRGRQASIGFPLSWGYKF